MTLDRYRSIIPDWSAFTAAAGRAEPTVFRVRTGRIAERDVLDRLAVQGYRTRPLEGLPGYHQVEAEPRAVSLTREHWDGLIYVQQASTGVAAPALGPRPGERVLDLCAAPGGKTTHMADLMEDRGCLVASEISENRIRGLLGNVYRLAHTNVMVVAGDGRDFPEGALFDRVLVDAPCSGEGTLRRRGGEPPTPSSSFLGFVTSAQRRLLERAVRLTRPGGTILYVTCTFSPDENEAVVDEALTRLPVELEPLALAVTHSPGLTSFEGTRFDPRLEGAARIYPHHFDSGGLFLARLRKLDDSEAPAGRTGGRSEGDAGATWSPDVTGHGSRAGRSAGGAEDGWGLVPLAFPQERDDAVSDDAVRAASDALERGLSEMADRYGVTADLAGRGWIMRGGRLWLHTLDEWPLGSWAPNAWRAISVGMRALEFDSRGRPKPTNDFLRWLGAGVTLRVVDLQRTELDALLKRRPVPTRIEERGPIALRWDGEVIGRGAVTVDGLKSEIPKARAADLARALPEE
jgi:NOL1/NOP2/sun family putative RNA methylase